MRDARAGASPAGSARDHRTGAAGATGAAAVIAAQPLADRRFRRHVADSLEPLPPPQDDLWDRIREGFAMPDLDDPLVAKWEAVVRVAARLRGADGRSQPALPLLHRRRGRGARHAARDRAPADGRERVQPERDVDEPRVGHLAVHPVDRQALRPQAELLVRFAPRRRRRHRRGAHLPAQAPRRLRRLAARAGGLQLGRRQRRQGDRAEPEARAGRPTTRASTMPDETRNYLPKLQAVKNIVRDPEKYGLALADIPDAPYFAVVKTTTQDRRQASRRSWPRCRWTSSCSSTRSTTGR